MTLAYTAWPADNHTHMWADPKTRGNPPPGVICPVCDMRMDRTAINPKYEPPRSYYDLSRAFDGDILVSPRLKEFLERQELTGLRFVEIPSSRRCFILQCTIGLVYIRPPTARMEEYCPACKQHKSIWGNKPECAHFAGVHAPIHEGVFFTDIKAGYYPQMGSLLIVGVDTWRSMVEQGFKGLSNGAAITN